MIFPESPINGEQGEKIFSDSDLSFSSNSLLKSGAFGDVKTKSGTAAQTQVRELMTSKEELTQSLGLSCLKELSKPRCKHFKGYPSSFILPQIV